VFVTLMFLDPDMCRYACHELRTPFVVTLANRLRDDAGTGHGRRGPSFPRCSGPAPTRKGRTASGNVLFVTAPRIRPVGTITVSTSAPRFLLLKISCCTSDCVPVRGDVALSATRFAGAARLRRPPRGDETIPGLRHRATEAPP
jgi:hypothetical protein